MPNYCSSSKYYQDKVIFLKSLEEAAVDFPRREAAVDPLALDGRFKRLV